MFTLNFHDFQLCLQLAMAGNPAVAGFGFEFGDADFLAFGLSDDFRLDHGAFEKRLTELNFIAVES